MKINKINIMKLQHIQVFEEFVNEKTNTIPELVSSTKKVFKHIITIMNDKDFKQKHSNVDATGTIEDFIKEFSDIKNLESKSTKKLLVDLVDRFKTIKMLSTAEALSAAKRAVIDNIEQIIKLQK